MSGLDAWAVVSDGCSQDGQTDLGARAWTLAARNLMQSDTSLLRDHPELFGRHLASVAQSGLLGELDYVDGFATLGLLHAAGETVRALFFGDGALLIRKLDGTKILWNLQFSAGAAFYLNYLRRPEGLDLWKSAWPGQELVVTKHVYDFEGTLIECRTDAFPASSNPWFWAQDIEEAELEVAMVATDGITSRRAGFADTGRELLAIKSSAGEFLHRRMGRAGQQWGAEGDLPDDDLAVAGIWLR